jgi:DNA-binding NtrC family response regulator
MKDSTKSYTGKTVLTVDDDMDVLEQLRMHLEAMGFTVIQAESQAEGEQILAERIPDLAIFDLMLENQDSGFVLSYKVKKKAPDVPVILITNVTTETGLHFDAVTEETRSWVKADIVLDKEIRYEQLKREIDRLMKG